MVSDTLFILLDIEKEEEASDKVEREDGSTIIMGDRRLRSLRLLNQRLWMFALFLLWQATKSSARTIACKQAQEGETDCPYCLYCL